MTDEKIKKFIEGAKLENEKYDFPNEVEDVVFEYPVGTETLLHNPTNQEVKYVANDESDKS